MSFNRLAFALLLFTLSSVTSNFHGVEDAPPHDNNTCWLSRVDGYELTNGSVALMCIPSTKTIIFEASRLTDFPHYIFVAYPDLVTVSAKQCFIADLFYEHSFFKDANQLRFLFLSNNNIEQIMNYTFSPATRLYKLEMSNSNVMILEPKAFENLNQLVHLDLSDNHIQELPHGIFDTLTALRTLVLSNNIITRIENGVFANNRLLSAVYLDSNSMVNVDRETFVTNSVKWLNLAENPGLGSLDLSWQIMENLTVLKVSNTGLQRIVIPSNAETVLADHNEIDHVVEAHPSLPNKLTRLGLAQNRMRNMDSLYAFTHLVTLDLSDNQLDSLDETELIFMPNLTQLSVARNPITTTVNVKALKKRFPELNSLLLARQKWTQDYMAILRSELKEHNITVHWDPDFRPPPVHWPASPPTGTFNPKEFELYYKELHENYTNFEEKLKMLQNEDGRQARIKQNIIDEINSIDERIKYLQNWLNFFIIFTTIIFVIVTSVYCGFSDLKQWFGNLLPRRRPQRTQRHSEPQPSTSRHSQQRYN